MAELRTTYGWKLLELPKFRTRAYNVRGYGAYSSPTTVAGTIQTEPLTMAPVTRNTKTTQDEIVVDWIALTSPQNGDSPVTSYNL